MENDSELLEILNGGLKVEPDLEYAFYIFEEVERESKENLIEFLREIKNDSEDVRYIIKKLDDRGNELEVIRNNLKKQELIKYLKIMVNPDLIIVANKNEKNEFVIIEDFRTRIAIAKQ